MGALREDSRPGLYAATSHERSLIGTDWHGNVPRGTFQCQAKLRAGLRQRPECGKSLGACCSGGANATALATFYPPYLSLPLVTKLPFGNALRETLFRAGL